VPGRLILCATPIGNLEDMSERAVKTLSSAPVLACENPSRTKKLLSHFGIRTPQLVVYNEGNERRQVPRLIEMMSRGSDVVLVSDAGMPGLSDPGYRLVRACVARGLSVEVVPGPSAAVTALALSGLPPGRFVFEGFLPRKAGDRRRRIDELRDETRTIVLYESPHRVEESLTDLAAILGPRPAVLARELTKLHEEVRRGSLPDLALSVSENPVRGEVALVIQGAVGEHQPKPDAASLADQARRLMQEGVDRKQALAAVAREAGVSKREVFDALVEQKDES
jgi:16S rRNA (cytidine1402-2'-O)-methyltransferase